MDNLLRALPGQPILRTAPGQPILRTAPGRPGRRGRKRKRTEVDPGFPKSCEVCNIVLKRKLEYDAHMTGKRHKKELKKKQIQEKLVKKQAEAEEQKTEDFIVIDPKTSLRTCTVCSLGFESPMVEQSHMNGKKHKAKVDMLLNKRLPQAQPMPPKQPAKQPLPPKKGYVGRCELCDLNYTSQEVMKTHLNGKKHKKNCAKQGQVETGVPTRSCWGKPFPKKIKLQPVITPSLTDKAKAHELLEKQAEEAYENYKNVATKIPVEEAQALYTKYQMIYKAYEAAFQEHMASKEETN